MNLIEKFRKAQIKDEEREKQEEIEEKRLENQLILKFYEFVIEVLDKGETGFKLRAYPLEHIIRRYFKVEELMDCVTYVYLNERGLKKLQKKVNKIKKEK